MELTVNHITAALRRLYDPPIRGLTSKRRRQIKKSRKRLRGTFRGIITGHSHASLLSMIEKEPNPGQGYYMAIPLDYRSK